MKGFVFPGWLRCFALTSVVFVLFSAASTSVFAQQMPDPKQISGVPLPMADMQAGTVTVRVIRGQLTNPLAGQTVELTGSGSPRTAQTDDAGRALFSGVAAGARVQARVTVNGERIESREFEIPATGGVRLMLVATNPDTERKALEDRTLAQGPAVPGLVILGDQSRFVIEVGDEAVNVFNILQIVNTARTPVQTSTPLVFELPSGATGAGVLEGSAPNAVAAGRRVTVTGPFPPGGTVVQFAYSLPLDDESVTIAQTLPAQMTRFTVIAQKLGAMQLSSPQVPQHREMSAEGQTYIVGQGPAVKAGDSIALTLTGLPHRPSWPHNLALALGGVILAAGAWGAMRRTSPDAGVVARLQERRERLFSELTALEDEKRRGTIEQSAYVTRRRDLMTALEGIYRQLDDRRVA